MSGTFEAQVMQFMRPDGRRNPTSTMLSDEVLPQYREMQSAGFRFESEVLRTGQVSVAISGDEDDADSEIVANGPKVRDAMEKMLKRKRWERKGASHG